MTSLLDLYNRPAPVDVAGTAYQERSPLWELIAGAPQGPQVKDPARMGNDPFVFNGGGTAARKSDLAWDDALASPTQRTVAGVMGSEPVSKLMMLANFLGPKAPMPTAKGVRAYHGSPHDFDKFDSRFIGTGEGAQAYGRGLYFAEKEGVAKGYRDALSNRFHSKREVTRDYTADDLARMAEAETNPQRQKNLRMVAAEVQAGRPFRDVVLDMPEPPMTFTFGDEIIKKPGHMYEVNIKADPADFLDWDVPLSQQSEKVRALLGHPSVKRQAEFFNDPNGEKLTGKSAYGAISKWNTAGDQRGGSGDTSHFRGAGIPGIRYKDQGSRGAEGGTSNLVVFDDNLIEIIRKYGLAGLLAGGASLATPSQGDAAP
jgi:hypothetical protein